ncbi:MAG TPA: glycosyltransferase [Gaiellaceae bacterium]|nr:glycosyltransferase [Gaiellaceae bacterium]
MRLLFVTLPGSGHFHPLVPAARAVQSNGHAVRIATAPSFHPNVVDSGFDAVAAGFDQERDGADERYASLQLELAALPENGPARTLFRIRKLFAGLYAERMVPDLLAIAEDWQPDVIVREVGEFGGCVAAEVLGIPHASVRSNTMLSTYSRRHLVGKEMSQLRAAYGLPPDPETAMLFRYLHLAFEPPGFHDPALPPAPTSHLLRPVPFSRSGGEGSPAWLAELPGCPTISATLGTVFNSRLPELFQAILDGLRDEPVNLILTIGRDQDPARFGPQPDNVHIERYIPQSLSFPHSDLVITHAGFSTVAEALTHGLPLVTIPIDADQPLNAERCAALGVARVIEHDQRTPAAIRNAVRRVLSDPSYRFNAERIRDEIARLPGPEHAAALLERLAVEQRALLSTQATG